MKKTSINTAFIVIALFATSLLHSCDDDKGYSLDAFRIELATVEPLGNDAYFLTLDDGKTLLPIASNQNYKPSKKQRVIVDYTILSDAFNAYDHGVRINQIANILTKPVVDLNSENDVSIGNDRIRILRLWIGDDYLNIEYTFNVGYEQAHYINLVNNTLVAPAEDGKIHLEFRHNANNDPEKSRAKGWVAFDLRPYMTNDEDSFTFVIKVKDFDKEKEYTVTRSMEKKLDSILYKDDIFDATQLYIKN